VDVALSSWRWASAACCMGMDLCVRRRSRPSAARAIIGSLRPLASAVVAVRYAASTCAADAASSHACSGYRRPQPLPPGRPSRLVALTR
jgi:hypothetical protein